MSVVAWSKNEQAMLDQLRNRFNTIAEGEFQILRAFVETAVLKQLPSNGWSFMAGYEHDVREFAKGFGVVI